MKKPYLLSVLSVLVALALWEILSLVGLAEPAFFSRPTEIVAALWRMLIVGPFLSDIQATLGRQLAGLSIGVSLGIICGLICGRHAFFRAALTPIIQLVRPIPAVAFTTLMMVWFGIGNLATIASITLGVFFPVWLNAYLGASQIPQMLLWRARLLTKSPHRIFRKVVLPATVPFIIAGIRMGIAISFILVFIMEAGHASNGLGRRITDLQMMYRSDEAMAGLVVLGTLGALSDYLFSLCTHCVFPWLKFSHNSK